MKTEIKYGIGVVVWLIDPYTRKAVQRKIIKIKAEWNQDPDKNNVVYYLLDDDDETLISENVHHLFLAKEALIKSL